MVGTPKSVTTKTHKSVNTRGTSARLATTMNIFNGCMNLILEISINCINCLCKVRYYFQYFIFINNSIKHIYKNAMSSSDYFIWIWSQKWDHWVIKNFYLISILSWLHKQMNIYIAYFLQCIWDKFLKIPMRWFTTTCLFSFNAFYMVYILGRYFISYIDNILILTARGFFHCYLTIL